MNRNIEIDIIASATEDIGYGFGAFDIINLTGAGNLAAPFVITEGATPEEGTRIFNYDATIVPGIHYIEIYGVHLPAELYTKKHMIFATYNDGAWTVTFHPSVDSVSTVPWAFVDTTGAITNTDIDAAAAIALTKLATLTASRAVVSTAGGVLSSATTTATEIGYVNGVTSAIQTQLNTKLTTGTAALVDADVNAAAAITLSKLAALTASRLLVSSAGGVITPSAVTSTEAGYLSGVTSAIQTQFTGKLATTLAQGNLFVGNGAGAAAAVDFSTNAQIPIGDGTTLNSQPITGVIALTNAGVTTFGANVVNVAALTAENATVARDVMVSFDTGFIGAGYKIYMPYKCELTYIHASTTELIEATNDGTVNFKDNAGNNMVGGSLVAGSLTATAGSVIGTVFTSTATGNNAFVSGDIMTMTTAKANAGGALQVTLVFSRLD